MAPEITRTTEEERERQQKARTEIFAEGRKRTTSIANKPGYRTLSAPTKTQTISSQMKGKTT